jgi:hypothetical protein
MFSRRTELTLRRVLLVYAWGLVAGAQIALYLYDYFDDGTAEALSGWIAIGLAFSGLALVWTGHRRRGSS